MAISGTARGPATGASESGHGELSLQGRISFLFLIPLFSGVEIHLKVSVNLVAAFDFPTQTGPQRQKEEDKGEDAHENSLSSFVLLRK